MIITSILNRAAEFNNVHSKGCDSSLIASILASHTLIKWNFPTDHFVKCNVDASLKEGVRAAYCGVFRDGSGVWLGGFVRNIGSASITMSKLWGVYSALQLAERCSLRHLWIDSDSKTAVDMIFNGVSLCHPCYAIIKAIKQLMNMLKGCAYISCL
ncbi:Ribonuclease H-like superfamily [Sesbania bispinosa]|nr:Ribonuclease H-like superfamily [Sesbania bispinosa]